MSEWQFKPEDFFEMDGAVDDIAGFVNAKLKKILAELKSRLLCYSTGASVLSEDKVKEFFEWGENG